MAVTSQQIIDFLVSNPGMSDAQIVAAMEQYGVSPAQMAQAVGLPEGEVVSRVAAVVPEGQAKLLGDTWVQPQYQVTGSGEDRQVGGIESVQTYKTSGGVNDQLPVGSTIQNYTPEGEFTGLSKTQKTESGLGEFALGAGLLFGLPSILNAGGAAAGGALGATEAATAFDLANAGIAGGTAGFTAAELAAINAAQAGATTGAGLLAQAPITNALTGTTGLLTPAATTAATGALTPATAATTAATSTLNPLVKAAIPAVTGALTGLTTPSALGSLLSQGLTLGGGLLQSQTSKEAAQQAQAMIDRETAAAKQAAAFTPVGMTTRFGSSQFQVDPVTGKLTSAGYTLSPEAKAAQDRFVKLAEQGIQQAEGAQQQFAPLQTGAQSLFTLGNKYLAQSPEQVAQNYLNQQMALLQPGRELELANLQNKLQQQGRGGLSVAQGGNLGATTPELQALFNARAQQEALLAAQAQQAGQQQVTFGANLLGTGAQTMGNYYAGQQAAYSPYTTALGQVQALEAAGQQPLTMGAQLGQTAAQAGANVGQLGLRGAGASVDLATGQAATNNPYAQVMAGLGANQAFGNLAGGLLGGGLSGIQSGFSQTGLGSSGFGTGLAYGNQDLGLFL